MYTKDIIQDAGSVFYYFVLLIITLFIQSTSFLSPYTTLTFIFCFVSLKFSLFFRYSSNLIHFLFSLFSAGETFLKIIKILLTLKASPLSGLAFFTLITISYNSIKSNSCIHVFHLQSHRRQLLFYLH